MNLEGIEIEELEKIMEEMAKSPREWTGIRQPGERCKYETSRTEGVLLEQNQDSHRQHTQD